MAPEPGTGDLGKRMPAGESRPAKGTLEVIAGCMFAGKTTQFIISVERTVLSGRRVQVFRIAPDGPYGTQILRAKSGISRSATFVANLDELRQAVRPHTDLVAVDEVHFLPPDFVTLAEQWVGAGMDVLLAGLDLDFAGRPFGPVPTLLALADVVTKRHAVCTVCFGRATRTQRLYGQEPARITDPLVVHGAIERYEPRCRSCHRVRS